MHAVAAAHPRTAATPGVGNVTGAADQFVRYAFPVGSLLRATSAGRGGSSVDDDDNVLTVRFGVVSTRVPARNISESHSETPEHERIP